MNTALRTCALMLAAILVLAACGPKPAPGETDRQHADDAFGQMK